MYEVGTAFLTVVPSFKNIERELKNIARQIGREVDRSIAEAIPQGVREGSERAARESTRAGRRAGEEFAGAWRSTMDRHLRGMTSKLGDDARDEIKDIRDDLNELREVVIRAEVDSDFAMLEFRRIRDRIRELTRGDHTIEMHFNLAEVLREAEQVERAVQNSRDEMDRVHEQALRDDQQRDQDKARRQRELNESAQRFIREQNRLEEEAHQENNRRDNERARRQRDLNESTLRFIREQNRLLREAHEENDRFDRDRARRRGGAFGEQARRRVGGVLGALPDLEPRFQSSNVLREMSRIRAEFERINRLELDVDLPADQWMREVAILEAALEALESNEIDIPTDIDLANIRLARAEIAALQQAARREGADAGDAWGGSFVRNIREAVRTAAATITDIEIGVDTTDAQIDIQELRARLLTLGNVRIGVDMSLADFIREMTFIEQQLADLEFDTVDIQVRLEAAAARAQLTALHNQVNAVDRDDIDIDVDADRAAFSLRNFADTVGVSMSRLGLLISLGASIGTAIVPAAAAAAASISAIATAASAAVLGIGVFALGVFGTFKAVQALDKYQKDADKSAQNLSASQARVAGAMDQVQSAQQSLRSSQRNLTRAEEEAADAVRDLAAAREEARRQLEDMRLAVKDTALAIRQARLDEAEAKKELDEVLKNPKASEAEREQARITHEERVLQLEELGLRQKRQVKDEETARKKGVEGSDQVKAAQERIASAMERVVDAQDSVASSQRAVAAANRALAQSYEKTGVAGGESLRNLREAMDALSPAGQRFAMFIFGLKDEFKGLQRAAEEGLLPGLQKAITNLLPYLAPLQNLVGRVARALGEGFVYATESLKDPIWQQFFSYLGQTAVPVLQGMFEFTMNVAKGIAGILLGLSGFNGPIGQGVLQWSRDFAEWGSTLDSNQGWQKFLQYVRDSWPEVRDFFSGLWEFTKKFVAAAAPIGEWVIGAFATLFEWMNRLDTDTWTIIIGAIAGVGAALLTVAGITSVITTGWAGLIIGLIALIAAEWAILYQKVEPVRRIMQALWDGAVAGFTFMWERVLKPGFAAWVGYMQVIGSVLNWLWDNVGKHVFAAFQIAFQVLWTVFQVFLGLWQIGAKVWGAIIQGLYTKYMKPVVDLLRPLFAYLGDVWESTILPNMKRGLKLISDAFSAFTNILKIPLKFIINTILNDGLLKAYNTVAKFFHVKPDDVKIELPQGFHTGGPVRGPGTGTSDSILARLSDGEHVLTAREVAKLGGQDQVYRLRSMIRQGVLPGFAAGGAVSKSGDESWFDKLRRKAGEIIGGIKDFFSDPVGKIEDLFNKLTAEIPGKGTPAVDIALGMPKKILGMVVDKVKGALSFGNGDTGPVGPGPGFLPWPSSPGASRGDSGVWRNILGLIRSTGPVSGSFGNAYRHGDPLWHGSGRAVDWMGYNQDALAQFFMNMRPRVLELIHTTNRGGYYISRGQRRNSMGRQDALHRNHIHIAMDQGGVLDTGLTSIYNGTGLPEAVLTDRQWKAMFALARGADGSAAPQYHFQFRDTTLDPGKLRAIQAREAAVNRVGRAH
jgi:hypothetical protein